MEYRKLKLTRGEKRAVVLSMLRQPIPELCDMDTFWTLDFCPASNMPKRSAFHPCKFCNQLFPQGEPWSLENCARIVYGRDEFIDVCISLLEDNGYELPGEPKDYVFYVADPFETDED